MGLRLPAGWSQLPDDELQKLLERHESLLAQMGSRKTESRDYFRALQRARIDAIKGTQARRIAGNGRIGAK